MPRFSKTRTLVPRRGHRVARPIQFNEVGTQGIEQRSAETGHTRVVNSVRDLSKFYDSGWEAAVAIAKMAADYRCQYPGCKTIRFAPPFSHMLHVHHKRSASKFADNDPAKNSPANLIVLCYQHHSLFHRHMR